MGCLQVPALASMYSYTAEVVRVVDGDTVELVVDCGFRLTFKDRFRLAFMDAPEKDKASTDHLISLLTPGDGKKWYIETFKQDKYGRWLVEIFNFVGSSINTQMILDGFATEYKK